MVPSSPAPLTPIGLSLERNLQMFDMDRWDLTSRRQQISKIRRRKQLPLLVVLEIFCLFTAAPKCLFPTFLCFSV